MWWRRSVSIGGIALAVLVASFVVVPGADAQSNEIVAAVETEPVPSGGDAADDPAIWVHPSDPALSTVIGTNKEGGLAVYDLDGNQLQYIPGFRPNNVDVMHNFPLGGESVDLVLSSDRDDDVITIHRVEVGTRELTELGTSVETDMSVYGICTYRSQSGYYVFVTPEDEGAVRQWRLTDDGAGRVASTLVRELPVGSIAEGCAADDELGYFYVAEETVGIWKYGAEPDTGTARGSVDVAGGQVDDDIEGLTIYYGPDQTGYLIASSQGSDEFVVYDRGGDNDYITRFEITGSGAIDGVTGTDGIAVTSVPLSPTFPRGMLAVQDGENDSENQNFKLVSWELIAGSVSPSLSTDAGPDPRGELVAPIDFTPPEPDPTWVVAEAVAATEDEGPLQLQEGATVTLRFDGLEVPTGAVVRNAYVQLTAMEPSDAPVTLRITAPSADEGTTPMAVTWAPGPWDEGAGVYQRTVDLASIINGVVGSDGWEGGDPLVLEIETAGSGSRLLSPPSEGEAPTLRLEYSVDA